MNVRDAIGSLPNSELDAIERRLTHHRAVVPAWQVQRLVGEVRRLKALEEQWRQGLDLALRAGDRESLALAAQEIVAGRQVQTPTGLGREAD